MRTKLYWVGGTVPTAGFALELLWGRILSANGGDKPTRKPEASQIRILKFTSRNIVHSGDTNTEKWAIRGILNFVNGHSTIWNDAH